MTKPGQARSPLGIGGAFVVAACASVVLAASPVRAEVDLSGFWELRDELPNPPPGKVTPEAQAHVAQLRRDRGPFAPEVRFCRFIGLPFFMGMSPPIDIVQGKREVVVMGETLSAPQHIYIDGRGFPDPAIFDPTSNGFSIGHYEGETLVAETRGFSETSGNPFIPGGGYKTTDTRLIERFKLIDGGRKLSVTFTWIDPKVFVEPNTYEFVYWRSEPGAYAQEFFCDSQDPAFGESVKEQPQN
jgi:hypothetical protein